MLFLLLPVIALLPTILGMSREVPWVYQQATFPPDYSSSDIRTLTYQYSPAFALAMQPLRLVPFEVLAYLFGLGTMFALAYLVGPVAAVAVALAGAPLIYDELRVAQINIMLAAVLVFAMQRPALWAVPILAKATPGIGLLWFAARGEWRYLARALGVTAAIALGVFIVASQSWFDWIGLLFANVSRADERTTVPLLFRAALAVPVIVWGARTDRIWTIPLAIAMCAPNNVQVWLTLLAVPRLAQLEGALEQDVVARRPGDWRRRADLITAAIGGPRARDGDRRAGRGNDARADVTLAVGVADVGVDELTPGRHRDGRQGEGPEPRPSIP